MVNIMFTQLTRALRAYPNLTIVVRAPSFHDSNQTFNKLYLEIWNYMIAYVHNHAAELLSLRSRLILMDWIDTIKLRSFGNDRIEGDMPIHYGQQVRLLFSQGLMHMVLKQRLMSLV